MSTRRIAKASRAVREVISSAVLFELNDPRIQNVTVLDVEVAPDMRTAKVYVSVMGDPKVQSRAIHGLNSARGFLQKKVAERIDTRYTPVLTFVLDQSVKKSAEASRILRELAEEREAAGTTEPVEESTAVDPEAKTTNTTETTDNLLSNED